VWISWHLFIATGILLGPVIPRGLDLQFTAVALLIAMLVPGLRCRSARAAAAAGALIAAVTYGLPGGTGLLVAALSAATLTSLFNWKRC
jgi:predicted branched-subunit amino acid permease